MKGRHDIIYLATEGTDLKNTDNNDFNILLSEPPRNGQIYRKYVAQHLVLEMLEKLRVVCGHTAMSFVEKQIKIIKEM